MGIRIPDATFFFFLPDDLKREKRRKEKTTKTVVGTYCDHVSLPLRAPSIWWQIANVGNVISWAEFIRDLRAPNPNGSGDNRQIAHELNE